MGEVAVFGPVSYTHLYREKIRKKVRVQGKHKKQSGGHGQYGDVWMEFEPGDQEDLVFEEKVVGGAVPKNFFPAVEKGLRDCISKGVVAGFPVVYLKATLVDGSYHDVDSSEMAFKVAAGLAYKAGLPQANPCLLYTSAITRFHRTKRLSACDHEIIKKFRLNNEKNKDYSLLFVIFQTSFCGSFETCG